MTRPKTELTVDEIVDAAGLMTWDGFLAMLQECGFAEVTNAAGQTLQFHLVESMKHGDHVDVGLLMKVYPPKESS